MSAEPIKTKLVNCEGQTRLKSRAHDVRLGKFRLNMKCASRDFVVQQVVASSPTELQG